MNKFLVALGVVLVAGMSQASYLWFTVQNNDKDYNNITDYLNQLKTDGVIESADQVFAKVWAVKGEEKVKLGSTGLTSEWQTDELGNQVNLSALGESANTYSYYIEICSTVDGYKSIGYNTKATKYDDLVANNSITESMTEVPAAQVWHGGSGGYKAAPEPTSAMLMLLGVAGLALKRKQKKA